MAHTHHARPRTLARSLRLELFRTFGSPWSFVWILVIALPEWFALSSNTAYPYALSAFGAAMSSPVSLALPIIVSAVYLVRVAREIQFGFIGNMRTRASVVRLLAERLLANAVSVAIVLFLYAFVSFAVMVWIAPSIGLLHFDATGYGPHYRTPEQFARLTELWGVSPLLYGIVYALWCAVNGVAWASVGFVALLFIRNVFVALSIPLVSCVALTAALSLLGLDIVAPYSTWILFGYVQSPFAFAFAPLTVVLLVLVSFAIRTALRPDRVPAIP